MPQDDQTKSRRRLKIWQLLGVALFAAFAGVAAYYIASFSHASTFNDERALRVLDDVSTQFNALILGRTTILKNLPEDVKDEVPECAPDGSMEPIHHTDESTNRSPKQIHYDWYLARLDLTEAWLCKETNAEKKNDAGNKEDGPEKVANEPRSSGSQSKPPRQSAATGQVSVPTAAAPGSHPAQQPTKRANVLPLCAAAGLNEVIYTIRDDRLRTIWCTDTAEVYAIEEPFTLTAQKYINQELFTEVVLAFPDGRVIAELPGNTGGPIVPGHALQHAVADTLHILNLKGLSHNAVLEPAPIAPADATASPTEAVSGGDSRSLGDGPTVFNSNIGDQSYRVYTLPFGDSGTLMGDDNPAGDAASAGLTLHSLAHPQSLRGADLKFASGSTGEHSLTAHRVFCVVGLRPINLSNEVFHTLWPAGLWFFTVLTVLSLASWPLVRLAYGPRRDSISRFRVAICLTSAVAIPVIGTVSIASVWDYFEIETWAALAAQTFGEQLDGQLRKYLVEGAEILDSYRNYYVAWVDNAPSCDVPPGHADKISDVKPPALNPGDFLLGFDKLGRGVHARLIEEKVSSAPRTQLGEPVNLCGTLQLGASATCNSATPPDWSPFKTVIALDRYGHRMGPVFTTFRPVDLKPYLYLGNRDYFKELKAGRGWFVSTDPRTARDAECPVSSDANSRAANGHIRVVSQRLFNRIDGSKTLQLAVPICDPNAAQDRFCGIITGDLRMWGLLLPKTPPLIRFAVIDTVSGTVIFHSNDSHSLSENFYLESELAPFLRAAIGAAEPIEYSGRYIDDPHELYYRPVTGTPWGVVVFYSTKDLGDLPFRAGSQALVAYAGCAALIWVLLGGIRAFVCVNFRSEKNCRPLIEILWPQAGFCAGLWAWVRWYPSLVGVAVLWVVTLIGWRGRGAAATAVAAIVLNVMAARLTKALSDRRRTKRLQVATVTTTSGPAERRTNAIDRSTAEKGFVEGVTCGLFLVAVLIAYALFVSIGDWQNSGLLYDEANRQARLLERRADMIQSDLRRWADPTREWHAGDYPTVWDLNQNPDLGFSGCREDVSVDPKSASDQQPMSEFWQVVWEATTNSMEQRRRLELLRQSESGAHVFCKAQSGAVESCSAIFKDLGSRSLSLDRPRGLLGSDQSFEWVGSRVLGLTLTIALAWLAVRRLVARLLARSLFALRLQWGGGQQPAGAQGAVPPNGSALAQKLTEDEFRIQWMSLSDDERLLMYRLALHHLPNPHRPEVVRSLIQRGYVKVEPFPRLIDPDMDQWVMRADSHDYLEALQKEATRGSWRFIGPSLFVIAMVLVAWLSWTAGGTMKAISAILLAAVAFMGQITQVMSFMRGNLGATNGKVDGP